jgi:RNA polymerase sigma-70 factor, ECF subfamily
MQQVQPSRRAEIAELYTRYGAVVLSRCRWLLKDDEASKDAAQEVFVKVLRSFDGFRNDASPLTWILRIATNHCLNVIAANKAKWHERFKAHAKLGEEEQAHSGAGEMERVRLVRALLVKLDVETQQVAVHYFVDEMTQEEIASALGRSLPTIRKRIEKFRRIAKKELGDERL